MARLRRTGLVSLLTANVLIQLLALLSSLIVAKWLTLAEFGDVRILQSYFVFFLILSGCGFDTAILRFCAADSGTAQQRLVLRVGIRRAMISTAIVFGLLLLSVLTGVLASSSRLNVWIVILGIGLPFAVVTQMLTVFLQAQRRIAEMARIQLLIRLQVFVLVVFSTWMWGFPGFVLATVLGYVFGVIPPFFLVKAKWLATAQGSVPDGFSSMACFSLLANGVTALTQAGLFFILDHSETSREEIGLYSLAMLFVLGASQLTSTVQSIATPYLSARCQDQVWFRDRMFRTQFQLAGVSALLAAILLVVAWCLIEVVYGPDFRPAFGYLCLLLPQFLLWSSYSVIAAAFLSLGLVHYNLAVGTIAGVVTLSAASILIGDYGVAGVAVGQLLGALLAASLTWLLIRPALKQQDSASHA
jgi:O-antigen/teichoic acid export membrane protein